MEENKEKEEIKNIKEEDFKKYTICINQVLYYDSDSDNLINKENTEDLICSICFYILKDPKSCSDKKNSHSFCKECIDYYLKDNNNNTCPTCKLNFEYKIKNEINNKLNKLSFQCMFKNKGCNEIKSYSEYLNHINECKYFIGEYECNIKKYNYNKKEFEKCGYIGNKENMENHIKICGLIKYKCLFCNENILQKDLEEHATNKCKFRIITYQDGTKYLGEIQNNVKNGYGIFCLPNGIKYKGEFKNDKFEGYGKILF